MPKSKINIISILVIEEYDSGGIVNSYLIQAHDEIDDLAEIQFNNENLSPYYLAELNLILYGYKLSEREYEKLVERLDIKTELSTSAIALLHPAEAIPLEARNSPPTYIHTFQERMTVNSLPPGADTAEEPNDFQQLLTKNLRQQQLTIEIGKLIRRSSSLKIIFDTVTQLAGAFLDCDRLTVIRLTQKEIALESQFWHQERSNNLIQLVANDFHPVELGQRDFVTTSQNSRLLVPILLEQALEPLPYYPLWGWLVAEHSRLCQWETPKQEFLEQLAIQLSIALSQKLLYQQLQNTDRLLQASKISNLHFKKLSLKDPLTKVYNRRYFKQQLNKEWFRLRRTNSYLSIILCDIDYFKLYNDTYGHQQGDICLQKVAETISQTIKRSADIVARYGGEEFVVIMPDTDGEGARQVAEKIRVSVKSLRIPHSTSRNNSTITLSSGVATTIPDAKYTPKMLLEAADDALYLAKNRGRNVVAMYEHSIALSSYQQNYDREWAQRIRYALDRNLFDLYAQPIKSLKGEDKNHFEILLRLEDREGQVFAPSCFFEIAERNCLMSSIDTWVVNELLEQLTRKGYPANWQNYEFSINLSGASLNDRRFLDFLSSRLGEHRLSPQLFCFEITEEIAIDNIKNIHDFIISLKKLGCSFALDDFGKGMCSLTYLKNFPIDYLKIDGSFIADLHQNKVSLVMVEAIKHLATGIGLKTVAEFVENQEILDTLHGLNIDYAQGYHLGRPQRLAEIV